jgi:hypothetical protein
MGCNRNDKFSCGALKVLFGGTLTVVSGPEVMDAGARCNSGSVRDCAIAGMMNVATGNPLGAAQVDRACLQQDPLACAVKSMKK